MKKLLGLTFMALLISTSAHARPVSYPGGWTSMISNNGEEHALHIHYSPTAKYSIGYKAMVDDDAEYDLNAFQLNYLIKRWNNSDSQANVYLKTALGVAHSEYGDFDNKYTGAGFAGIAADWENRRFFTSYENRYLDAGTIANKYTQSARIGVAPYIGDYGDLHTWLMLEVNYDPEGKDPITVTPLVRLFKDINLVEAGISNQGDVLLNWYLRF